MTTPSPQPTHTPQSRGLAAGIVHISVARPWLTLLIGALCIALSILALRRTSADGSLSAMLGDGFESSAALASLTKNYHAADELLILADLPDSHTGGDTGVAQLLAFAQRLQAAAAADPEFAQLYRRVLFAPDPAIAGFIRNTVVPAGLFYLNDAEFAQLIDRLTPAGISAQMARNESLIAAPGPAAAGAAKAALRDPLRLRDFLSGRLGGLGGGASLGEDGNNADLSPDRRAILIRIEGARPVSNLAFATRFTTSASKLAAGVNTDNLKIRIAGAYAIAAHAATRARADSISSTVSSVFQIQLLFVILYRRFFTPLLIVMTAGVGILMGFGLHALWSPSITPLSAVIAAMLGGLGVDYGIHLLSHYDALRRAGLSSAQASVQAAGELGVGLAAACMTTIFGFLSLVGSKIAMLRDFAILGSVGLLGSLLAMLTLFPAALTLIDRRPAKIGRAVPALIAIIANRSGRWIGASIAIAVAAIAALVFTPGHLPRRDTNLTSMHPQPNEPIEAQQEIERRYGHRGEAFIIELSAKSPEQLLTNAHDAEAALHTGEVAQPLEGTLGPATLLPDPRTREARRKQLSSIDRTSILRSFDEAVATSAFDPAAFAPFREFLGTLLTPADPPSWSALLNEPDIARRMLPQSSLPPTSTPPTGALMLVRLREPFAGPADRDSTLAAVRAALAGVTGARLTGVGVVTSDLERATREDLPLFIALSSGLVLIWLLIVFRRPIDIALALIPVGFSLLCTVGFMTATRTPINTVNAIALPLLAGIAVDSGVFLVGIARAKRDRSSLVIALHATTLALIGALVTTILGFGTLYWTHTPAIQSLGIVSSVGVTAGGWAAMFLLMPILIRCASTSPVPGGAS